MKAYLEEKEAVLAELGSSMEGLSDGEAAERLTRERRPDLWEKYLQQTKEV